MTEPTVTNETQGPHQQYQISVDGTRVGLAAYVDTDTQRIFHHTEIADEFRGRGLGGKLMEVALADTRAAGKRIVAICEFVASYVDEHDEYADVVDPVTAQSHAAVRRA